MLSQEIGFTGLRQVGGSQNERIRQKDLEKPARGQILKSFKCYSSHINMSLALG